MSKSNAFEQAMLDLVFLGVTIEGIAERDTTSPNTDVYVAFHTADPGEAGDQTTNECAYTGYARAAVPIGGAGFVRTGSTISPVNDVVFPAATGGNETATHFSIGRDAAGTGMIFYFGPLTPNVPIANGVTPRWTAASTITED